MKQEVNKGKVTRILSEMLSLLETDDFYVEDIRLTQEMKDNVLLYELTLLNKELKISSDIVQQASNGLQDGENLDFAKHIVTALTMSKLYKAGVTEDKVQETLQTKARTYGELMEWLSESEDKNDQ